MNRTPVAQQISAVAEILAEIQKAADSKDMNLVAVWANQLSMTCEQFNSESSN